MIHSKKKTGGVFSALAAPKKKTGGRRKRAVSAFAAQVQARRATPKKKSGARRTGGVFGALRPKKMSYGKK
jgi:hypothetical protein